MNRISRIDLAMEVARLYKRRATCRRGQVGALLMRDNRIIATGYNGPPEGQPHCEEHGCDLSLPCTHAIHAEANLIAFCAKEGIRTKGATLIVTASPCLKCSELIIQAGIRQVVYDSKYRDDSGKKLLLAAGILFIQYNKNLKVNLE